MLVALFSLIGRDTTIIGFNIKFDLSVLLRRALYLGIKTPPIYLDKWKCSQAIDLMEVLSFNGLLKNRGLSWYCKRFGLGVPEDTTTGADMPRLAAEGKWDEIRFHCEADVFKTVALAKRLGVLREVPAEMVL